MAVQIARDQTVALTTAPGQRLCAEAAPAWDAAVTAYGPTVLLTDSWRSYEVQERVFRDRYRIGNHAGKAGFTTDVRYWQGQPWTRRTGTAAAAVPGTSNHGTGRAVDVKSRRTDADPAYPQAVIFTSFQDVDRARFLTVARRYGWCDCEGRAVSEWWHFTFRWASCTCGAKNAVIPAPAPAPTPAPTPTPAAPDLWEDPMRDLIIALYHQRLGRAPLATEVGSWLITAASMTPAQVVAAITGSAEAQGFAKLSQAERDKRVKAATAAGVR